MFYGFHVVDAAIKLACINPHVAVAGVLVAVSKKRLLKDFCARKVDFYVRVL